MHYSAVTTVAVVALLARADVILDTPNNDERNPEIVKRYSKPYWSYSTPMILPPMSIPPVSNGDVYPSVSAFPSISAYPSANPSVYPSDYPSAYPSNNPSNYPSNSFSSIYYVSGTPTRGHQQPRPTATGSSNNDPNNNNGPAAASSSATSEPASTNAASSFATSSAAFLSLAAVMGMAVFVL